MKSYLLLSRNSLKLSEKLYAIYLLAPYKRTMKFILSILFSKKINLFGYSIPVTDYLLIRSMLQLNQFSQIFEKNEKGIKISFDGVNTFHISRRLDYVDKSLIRLLEEGIKDGAYFIDEHHEAPMNYDKAIKIIQSENIIQVSNGVRFNLDNIGAVTEIFIRRIHDFYSENLDGKIVLDLGASVGDTPLYFASQGATVYAVEMTRTNFEAMKKNIELNPHLTNKIIPIHLAFGKDETIDYYQDSLDSVYTRGGASFVKNKFSGHSIKNQVQGMSLKTIRKKYDLNSIDLLKIDCKGGEFFLQKNELDNIETVKIEYYSLVKDHDVSKLKNIFEGSFNTIMFKHTPSDNSSFKKHGNILAKRKPS